MAKCTSCRKETQNGIRFSCPKCGKDIFRCDRCRTLSIDYKCTCNFEGP